MISRYLPKCVDAPQASRCRARFDWLGTIPVLRRTLGAYSLAMTFSGKQGFGAPLVLQLGLAALVGLVLFLAVQVKARAPLLQLSLFRNALLSLSMVMSVLVYAVMMATLVLGRSSSPRRWPGYAMGVGLVMTVGPLAAAIMGRAGGHGCGPIGARLAMVIGLALFTLATVRCPGFRSRRGGHYVVANPPHQRRPRLLPDAQQHRRHGPCAARAARARLRAAGARPQSVG